MKAIAHDNYPLFPYPVPMSLVPDFDKEPDPEDVAWYAQREALGTKALLMLEFCQVIHEQNSLLITGFCEERGIEAITFDTKVPAEVAIGCTMLARIELIARWINEAVALELWDSIPFIEEYLFRAIGTGEKIRQVSDLEDIWAADGDEDIPEWPADGAES